jgi:hypothetical protein
MPLPSADAIPLGLAVSYEQKGRHETD